jgi:predicted nucleic acid-binding protein
MNGIRRKEMMRRNVIFDSNILILLSKNALDAGRFAGMFCKDRWLVSVVTMMEVLSKPGLSAADRVFLLGFLSKCKVVNLSRKITVETIRFRSQINRKLPDSIIAASAIVLKAVLVSNDPHLSKAAYPGLTAEKFQ